MARDRQTDTQKQRHRQRKNVWVYTCQGIGVEVKEQTFENQLSPPTLHLKQIPSSVSAVLWGSWPGRIFGPFLLSHPWSAGLLDTCLHQLFVWTLGSKLSGRLTLQVPFLTSSLPSYFREGSWHWLRLNPCPFPCLLSVLGVEPRVLCMLSMCYFTTELHPKQLPFLWFVLSEVCPFEYFWRTKFWLSSLLCNGFCSFCCVADCSTHISVT